MIIQLIDQASNCSSIWQKFRAVVKLDTEHQVRAQIRPIQNTVCPALGIILWVSWIYIYIFCTRVQSGLGRNNWLTHMYFYAPLIGRKKSCFWLWFISENREKGWKSQGTNSGSNSTELCVLKLNLPIVSLLKRCLIVCATGSIVCSLCAYSQPTQYCTCSSFLSLTFLYSFVKKIILRRWDSVQDGVQTHPLIILRDYNVAERLKFMQNLHFSEVMCKKMPRSNIIWQRICCNF